MTEQSKVNRNASASAFGWEFQVNAAMVLFIKHINDATNLKVEGEHDDIEIELMDGDVVYAQAKARANNDPGSGSTNRLDGALATLADDAKEGNYHSLVYVTNDDYPFGKERVVSTLQGGGTLRFSELPPEIQEYVKEKGAKYGIDDKAYEAMEVSVIGYYGDDRDTKHKNIRKAIQDFLMRLNLHTQADVNDGKLRDQWGIMLHENAEISDAKASVSKEDFIWPMVVMLCNTNSDDKFFNDYDEDIAYDVLREYQSTIDCNSQKFEFVTKVYSDFDLFKKSHEGNTGQLRQEYVNAFWENYVEELGLQEVNDAETRELVTKLIISKVLRRKSIVETIKDGVNLDS